MHVIPEYKILPILGIYTPHIGSISNTYCTRLSQSLDYYGQDDTQVYIPLGCLSAPSLKLNVMFLVDNTEGLNCAAPCGGFVTVLGFGIAE